MKRSMRVGACLAAAAALVVFFAAAVRALINPNYTRKRSAGLKRNSLHYEKLCFLGMKFASTGRRGWRLLADLPRSVTY
jgi:hypothetical protein